MVAEPVRSRERLGHDSDARQALVLLLSSFQASEQPHQETHSAPSLDAGVTGVGLGTRQT